MTPFGQIQKGVAAYLDGELMPLLDDSTWKRVAAGAAMSLAIQKSANYIPLLKQNKFVDALGLIDDQGNVNLNDLVPAVKANIPNTGMKVDIPLLGTMTFKSEDVDKLVSYIQQAGRTK